MTWEELKEEAKKMGANENIFEDAIFLSIFMFCKEGSCFTEDGYPNNPFSVNRTPDQMLAIMKALQ